jgi:arylsulfatase A-like enzyme
VLVYCTCSLNKDYIAPYDPDVATTPNLAEFARDGMVFDRHHTEAGASGIAFASILTGGHAPHHGVFYHPSRITPEIVTLSEVFAQAGYETYFWATHPMARRELNYGQGVSREHSFDRMLHGGQPEFVALLDDLRENPTARAFVLHTNAVPHSPYATANELIKFTAEHPAQSESFDARDVSRLLQLYRDHHIALQFNYEATVRDLALSPEDLRLLSAILDAAYRTQVNLLDRLFGSIWDAIVEAGLADDALVVFTSDHGETLDRGNALFRWSHGLHLAHDVMNVPLIIRGGDGRVPAGRFRSVSRSIDLLPTVAGLAGLPLPDTTGAQGVDLSDAIRGGSAAPTLTAFFHTEFNPSDAEAEEMVAGTIYAVADKMFPGYTAEAIWVGARHEDLLFKLRRMDGETWQLAAFDLAADPTESRDMFDPQDPQHRTIAEELHAYKAWLVGAFHRYEDERSDELDVEDEERLEALRSLGYIQ